MEFVWRVLLLIPAFLIIFFVVCFALFYALDLNVL
jgi:hypothetical protein